MGKSPFSPHLTGAGRKTREFTQRTMIHVSKNSYTWRDNQNWVTGKKENWKCCDLGSMFQPEAPGLPPLPPAASFLCSSLSLLPWDRVFERPGQNKGTGGGLEKEAPLDSKSSRRLCAFFLKSSAEWMRPVLNFSLCFFSICSLSNRICWKVTHSPLRLSSISRT